LVARGLLAVASFEPWNREALLAQADGAIRAAFAEVDPNDLLTVMPDLGWADIELAQMRGGRPSAAGALRDLRDRTMELMIGKSDVIEADRDLRGAFVLNTGGSPLPTWQSLRPTGLFAAMLGEPSLTPGRVGRGEATKRVIELTEMLRFLEQLMAEDRLGHMYADPGLAMGGVRASLWDQTMPLTASALGLVTLSESLESLKDLSARPNDAAGRP